MDDMVDIWGADRVGVKLSPTNNYNDAGQGDMLDAFSYVISELNKYGLAFLAINEEMPFTTVTPKQTAIIDQLQSLWKGAYVAYSNYTAESGNTRIQEGKATAITFGRAFIENPDLPVRFKQNGPYNELDPNTFYGGDHRGYTDYPFLNAG